MYVKDNERVKNLVWIYIYIEEFRDIVNPVKTPDVKKRKKKFVCIYRFMCPTLSLI